MARSRCPGGEHRSARRRIVDLERGKHRCSGQLFCPRRSISATAYNISPEVAEANLRDLFAPTPPANAGRGTFRLGPGATIDVAGLAIDDRVFHSNEAPDPVVMHGGTASVTAFSASLGQGSLIDVSGGARLYIKENPIDTMHEDFLPAVDYDDGGAIHLVTGQDPKLRNVTGGTLSLQGSLRGYSGAHGGDLSLQALLVQIGGGPAPSGGIRLARSFFEQGGFASYSVTGIGQPSGIPDDFTPGVLVAPGDGDHTSGGQLSRGSHQEWWREVQGL